eukprot:6192440-Pleurochrysis_carterae.AAC.1
MRRSISLVGAGGQRGRRWERLEGGSAGGGGGGGEEEREGRGGYWLRQDPFVNCANIFLSISKSSRPRQYVPLAFPRHPTPDRVRPRRLIRFHSLPLATSRFL